MNQQEHYQTQGYCIFEKLIPLHLIDRLLSLYERDIVVSSYPFFRQNTSKYEENQLTEAGHVKQSFLDIHEYEKYPEFSDCAKEIYCSSEIQEALRQITGSQSFNLMQTMLFDANVETPPHQDWWYLDSVPNGHLFGAWIALEDIDEQAGRFYILPQSMEVDLHSDTPNLPHSLWLERVRQYVGDHKDQIKAPVLKKGDVLFWNSRTIHGSLPTQNSSLSRKSLTGHFLPSEYKYGNLFTTKEFIEYRTYKGVKYYRNQPDYSFLNKLKFDIKFMLYDSPILLKAARQLQALSK